MLRLLVTPRWLLRHVLLLACVAVCIRLASWQWGRSQSPTGTLQNFGYALQWPLIGAFCVLMWWKLLRAELAERRGERVPDRIRAPRPIDAAPASLYRRGEVPVARGPAPQAVAGAAEDPELAAYNAMLAQLADGPRGG